MLLLQVLASDTLKVLSVNPPMTFKECFSDPSTIIAISAVAISLVGLGLALYSAHLTRKHNRLSVEPLIQHTFDHSSNENVIFANIDNYGLGTAIINKVKLLYEDKSYDIIDPIIAFLPKCNVSGKKNLIGKTNYLSSNASLLLFEIKFDKIDDSTEFTKLMKKVTLDIEYCSIYGKKKNYNHLIHWEADPINIDNHK